MNFTKRTLIAQIICPLGVDSIFFSFFVTAAKPSNIHHNFHWHGQRRSRAATIRRDLPQHYICAYRVENCQHEKEVGRRSNAHVEEK